MKAHELQSHLRSLNGGWMNLEETVDTFKAGSPDTDIKGIAVGWMSYTWALLKAIELGCNIFITHEPTYYDHYDNNTAVFDLPGVRAKQRFIEEKQLVIIRCHDLWDQMPQIGIADAWGELLGLGEQIAGDGYFRVYDVTGKTATDLAQQVAARTLLFGQDAVELVGPPDKPVTRAFIGTGAITPFFKSIVAYQADLAICTNDGFTHWRDGAYAIDMGLPVIVVDHAVSEQIGILNLARHLQAQFPNVPVHHIPQPCMYKLVRG